MSLLLLERWGGRLSFAICTMISKDHFLLFLTFYFVLEKGWLPWNSDSKESAYNVEDPGSVPALRRSPGEGNGNPLQYTGLENLMNKGTWQTKVHGVAESRTWLSDFTSLCITSSTFIHLIITDLIFFLFMAEQYSILYVPQFLYPLICWWISRLLPCPGNCK